MNISSSQQDRVIDGALACVARVGLGKTTLDDVAREAGCARATVYRCFPGKQALFAAALKRELDALGARAIDAAGGADSLADAVVAVMLTGSETFHSHAALRFVVDHEHAHRHGTTSSKEVIIGMSIVTHAPRPGRARQRQPACGAIECLEPLPRVAQANPLGVGDCFGLRA